MPIRLPLLALAATATLGCSSFHGLHSARAMRAYQVEAGAEVSHSSLPAEVFPLGGIDPRIEASGVDLGGRLGLGDQTDVAFRLGTSGLEATLLRQLSHPDNPWFAVAGVVSARGRVLLGPNASVWRLFDFVLSVPLELNPHPRLALIVEPKGMVTGAFDCTAAGTACRYYPFHAGVSGGARVRLFGGMVLGAEVAWYPIPIVSEPRVVSRPTSWEASISLSWITEVADGRP